MECLYLIRNGVPFDVAFSMPTWIRYQFIASFQALDEVAR
jgi:hypothetical protein